MTANVTRRNMLYDGRFISISYTHNDTGIQPQANGSIYMADAVNTASMVFNTHIQQYVIRFISRYSLFIRHYTIFAFHQSIAIRHTPQGIPLPSPVKNQISRHAEAPLSAPCFGWGHGSVARPGYRF